MIALISVYDTRSPEREMYERILYNLLEERKLYQSISHKELPTYENHVKFVRSKPYKQWFILQDNKLFVGSVYLTKDNEIGIFIFEDYLGVGYGHIAIEEILKLNKDTELIKANIAPTNSNSLAFFCNQRFQFHHTLLSEDAKHIVQYTFTKVNPYYVS